MVSPVALPTLYVSKPPFARSNARRFEGGLTLRWQVQPRQLPDLVIPTSVGLPIYDFRFSGYRISQLQARGEIPAELAGANRDGALGCRFPL